MVTAEELLSRYGNEWYNVEYKSATDGIPLDFWETYSSFANTSGGHIILGVSENQGSGELVVTGVKSPDHILKVLWDTLNNPAKVNLNLLVHSDVTVAEVGNKTVIIVNVPVADRRDKPIYLNGNMDSCTYKRNHEGNYKCRKEEIRSMVRDSFEESDNAILEGIDGYECFDMSSVKAYLGLLDRREHTNRWTGGKDEEVLSILGAISVSGGKIHPTRAGLLMFGKVSCILRTFPDFRLDYREQLTDNRWDYRLFSDDLTINLNVFNFLSEVLERLRLKIGVFFGLDGYVRNADSVNLMAVREAVVNALAHADYMVSGGVSVVLTGKGVTVTNPGGFRIPLEKAKLGGISDPRNHAIMRMLLSIGLVEQMGSGIYSLYKSIEDGTLMNLTITEESSPLRVVTELSLLPPNQGLGETERTILRYLSVHNSSTLPEIAKSTGISNRTASMTLKKMAEDGLVFRTGNTRGVRWSRRI